MKCSLPFEADVLRHGDTLRRLLQDPCEPCGQILPVFFLQLSFLSQQFALFGFQRSIFAAEALAFPNQCFDSLFQADEIGFHCFHPALLLGQ